MPRSKPLLLSTGTLLSDHTLLGGGGAPAPVGPTVTAAGVEVVEPGGTGTHIDITGTTEKS